MAEPTELELKAWRKKWKKFHKSQPKKAVFRDGGFQLTFYKDEFGGYSLEEQPRLSWWQRSWELVRQIFIG